MAANLMKRLEAWALAHNLPRWTPAAAVGTLLLLSLVIAAMLSGDPSASSSATGAASMTGLVLDVSLKFGIVLVVLALSLQGLKVWQKRVTNNPDKNMAIVESIRLSPRQALHLVRVGERVFLVGATDAQISCLSEVEAAAQAADPALAWKPRSAELALPDETLALPVDFQAALSHATRETNP